jgi:hypothetical protein
MKPLLSSVVLAIALGVSAAGVVAAPPGPTGTTMRIGEFSSQVAPNHAIVGARIVARRVRRAQADISTHLGPIPLGRDPGRGSEVRPRC